MDYSEIKLESFEHNRCWECGETFKEWTDLVNHRENSHILYTCNTCTKEEKSVIDFEYHLQIHGGIRLFKCIICNENFSFLSELNDHLSKHLSEVRDLEKIEYVEASEIHDEPCSQDIDIKSEDSDNESNKLDHFPETEADQNIEEIKYSELMELGEEHKNKKTYNKSKKPKREKLKKKEQSRSKLEKKFKCPHCPQTAISPANLKHHIRTHTGEKPFECADCGKCYLQKCALRIHITMKHDSNKKRTEACHLCGKTFYFTRVLKNHIREIHTNRERYPCSICGKTYSSKHAVDSHIKSHVEEPKEYNCPKCDKVYKTYIGMRQHNRQVHIFGKQFKCNWESCEFSSCNKERLILHKRTHTGEKPFKCKLCGKFFSSKSSLKSHIVYHGAPMHQCDLCEKSFKTQQCLKVHIHRIHAERKFNCLVCDKKYASNSDAMRHMRDTHSIGKKDKIDKVNKQEEEGCLRINKKVSC
ncbi:zinc finger protein 888-like [Phlebotomus papatasi]|uniref:zinc finger protein 888-like n=1 Tax=Phlebotomus papatasi TaxID=29031 RepID=UPI0024841B9F|nr:zinc finger protein 888-like [Phlebotomus papatasi]